jgi:hypothetical protein
VAGVCYTSFIAAWINTPLRPSQAGNRTACRFFLASYFPAVVSRSTNSIPHLEQVPGLSKAKSGCMVQVYLLFVFTTVLVSGLLHEVMLLKPNADSANMMINFFMVIYCL